MGKFKKIPEHHGKFPFEPDRKVPALLDSSVQLTRLFGKDENLITSFTSASTNRIHNSTFVVLPGKHFEPPSRHTGDEVYFILEGEMTLFSAETGETLVAEKGDFVYIPAGTWHQAWNFSGGEIRVIAWIAPQLWSEEGGPATEYDGSPVFYKGRNQ